MPAQQKALNIVVPFYKHPELASKQLETFLAITDELITLKARLILINDSPSNPQLQETLRQVKEQLTRVGIKTDIVTNAENIGFVKSANIGLDISANEGADVLLLNSDAFLLQGTVSELKELLSLDEKFGFVVPRSNNTTISALPTYYHRTDADPELAYELYKLTKPHLPRYQLIPTAPGFCVLIKNEILKLVGYFDEIYSPGYNEENDLVMRANRLGFVCVLANWVYCLHLSSASFSDSAKQLEIEHAKVLATRFPEYQPNVARYLQSPQRTYERLVEEFILTKNRPSVLLDLTMLSFRQNGTSFIVKTIADKILNSEEFNDSFKLAILGDPAVLSFYELSVTKFKQANLLNWLEEAYSIRLYLAQPFNFVQELSHFKLACQNVYYFLDNIASDCLYLKEANYSIDELWQFVANYAGALAFLSNYSKNNFYLRFERKNKLHDKVILPSVNPSDYYIENPKRHISQPDDFIFVVGNNYVHKRVKPVIELLSANLPNELFITGIPVQGLFPNVKFLNLADFSREEILSLFNGAKCIIFPSTYEGFGFPIVEALSYGKTVLAYEREVNYEIKNLIKDTYLRLNLVLFNSDSDLIDKLRDLLSSNLNPGIKPTNLNLRSFDDVLSSFKELFFETAHDDSLLQNTFEALRAISLIEGYNYVSYSSIRQSYYKLRNILKSRSKTMLKSSLEEGIKKLPKRISR